MKIGVIGAGTMGQGIAKAFAQVEGFTVALCDIKQEWAENGLAKIKKGYEKLVAKGKMTQEKADAIVAAITPGLKEDLCADCDLVVEAAFEDMKVKQTTFGELDKICKPECIFASNTSWELATGWEDMMLMANQFSLPSRPTRFWSVALPGSQRREARFTA